MLKLQFRQLLAKGFLFAHEFGLIFSPSMRRIAKTARYC